MNPWTATAIVFWMLAVTIWTAVLFKPEETTIGVTIEPTRIYVCEEVQP